MSEHEASAATQAEPSEVDSDLLIATKALTAYSFGDGASLRVLNVSENTTYLVEKAPKEWPKAILRVHREGYHSRAAIESELAWQSALCEVTDVLTSEAIPNDEGDFVTTVRHDGVDRFAVLFHFVPGSEPDDDALSAEDFATLGATTAQMHQHARSWTPPEWFTRFAWDWEHSLGEQPRWGRWEDGFGVGDVELAVLSRATELVRMRLEEYGTTPDRFGLVHADLRVANLLVDDDTVTVIDFDDSGFSWYMYDFGAAVSFIEHDPRLREWQDAWVRGYRTVAALEPEDEAMLPTFVMLRRLLLIAWMGTHSHAKECQELGPGYTADTVPLAQRYLATDGLTI